MILERYHSILNVHVDKRYRYGDCYRLILTLPESKPDSTRKCLPSSGLIQIQRSSQHALSSQAYMTLYINPPYCSL